MINHSSEARQRILQAFARCLLEQPYEQMSVSAVLRRAEVGRTTFYAQFRGKEALFAASVQGLAESLIQAARQETRAWAFLWPFLRHVDSHRSIYNGFVGRESAAVLERQMHRLFAQLLADDLMRRHQASLSPVREAAMIGALWALLVAWIERRIDLGPAALAQETAAVLDGLKQG